MFDAKSLLDAMVAGASQQADGVRNSASQSGGGGLADLLSGFAANMQSGAGQAGEVAGDALGQATGGVKQAAGELNDATGIGDLMGSFIQQMSGKSAGELLGSTADLVKNNKEAAGAIAVGLGGLLLGTKTGRSITGSAAKLGGLALLGGLAYKAYQNNQAGKPLLSRNDGEDLEQAPDGSGFEAAEQSSDNTALYIKAMISAAASDGHIDKVEQDGILGAMKSADMDDDAMSFLATEFANPASIDELAAGVDNERTATMVYTAARLAIEPDSRDERNFLRDLASSLSLSDDLVAQLDAAASSAKA